MSENFRIYVSTLILGAWIGGGVYLSSRYESGIPVCVAFTIAVALRGYISTFIYNGDKP